MRQHADTCWCWLSRPALPLQISSYANSSRCLPTDFRPRIHLSAYRGERSSRQYRDIDVWHHVDTPASAGCLNRNYRYRSVANQFLKMLGQCLSLNRPKIYRPPGFEPAPHSRSTRSKQYALNYVTTGPGNSNTYKQSIKHQMILVSIRWPKSSPGEIVPRMFVLQFELK